MDRKVSRIHINVALALQIRADAVENMRQWCVFQGKVRAEVEDRQVLASLEFGANKPLPP